MTDRKEQYVDTLSLVPIFSAIPRDKLMELYDHCELLDFASGDYLMEEGTPAEEIYVVLDGEVSIQLHHNGDEPFEVTRLGVGSCLGETSVIGIQNHSADVVATCDSTFLLLKRTVLMTLFGTDTELFALLVLNIARELARRLKAADHTIELGLNPE